MGGGKYCGVLFVRTVICPASYVVRCASASPQPLSNWGDISLVIPRVAKDLQFAGNYAIRRPTAGAMMRN